MAERGAQLTRSREDRLLGGVAGGLAEFLGVDVTVVRIAFVLLCIFGGSGLVLYVAMWLLVPPADAVDRTADENLREGVTELRSTATRVAGGVRSVFRGSGDGDDSADG